LLLLLLMIWQHRRGKTRNIYVNQIREHSPIIGVKLADNRSNLKIEASKKDRSALLQKTGTKQKKTKEQVEKLKKQIQLLQLEISKHKQNEVRLERQVTELMTTNKKLQQETLVINRVKQQPTQRTGEIKSPINQSKHRTIESKELNWMLREKTQQVRTTKEISEQPLDVEKLKTLAALVKQIQGHRR
jgi:hypothetical protein